MILPRHLQAPISVADIKEDPDAAAAAAFRVRQSRDERKARDIGIPFSIAEIINLPMDEFNDMLSRHELNEEQLSLCRDIRRRGKNKVGASVIRGGRQQPIKVANFINLAKFLTLYPNSDRNNRSSFPLQGGPCGRRYGFDVQLGYSAYQWGSTALQQQ